MLISAKRDDSFQVFSIDISFKRISNSMQRFISIVFMSKRKNFRVAELRGGGGAGDFYINLYGTCHFSGYHFSA